MNKLIFGLVGQMASGKGTIAEYLKEKYQADFFTFSTPLRDILKRLHIETNRQNLQDVSTVLRQLFGQDLLANILFKDALSSEKEIVIIDGIRRFEDIENLRKEPNFILISVETDEKIRYERLIARAQNKGDGQKTFIEFLADHQKETELKIPAIMAEAQEKINNNGNLENLYQQIEKIIQKYK